MPYDFSRACPELEQGLTASPLLAGRLQPDDKLVHRKEGEPKRVIDRTAESGRSVLFVKSRGHFWLDFRGRGLVKFQMTFAARVLPSERARDRRSARTLHGARRAAPLVAMMFL